MIFEVIIQVKSLIGMIQLHYQIVTSRNKCICRVRSTWFAKYHLWLISCRPIVICCLFILSWPWSLRIHSHFCFLLSTKSNRLVHSHKRSFSSLILSRSRYIFYWFRVIYLLLRFAYFVTWVRFDYLMKIRFICSWAWCTELLLLLWPW